jgi:predicted SprT family Zn-dependent metalloprotease
LLDFHPAKAYIYISNLRKNKMQQRTKEQALLEISRYTVQHGVSNYSIYFAPKLEKKTDIATCDTYNKRFGFVEFYALHLTDDDFKKLILHEISHALTPHHGHDRVFRNMSRKIGGNPLATLDASYLRDLKPKYLEKKVNYIYKCPECQRTFFASRMWKNRKSCKYCSPKFDVRFLLELT